MGARKAVLTVLALIVWLAGAGVSPTQAHAAPAPAGYSNSWYVPWGPQRIYDSRLNGSNPWTWLTEIPLPTNAPTANISGWVLNVTVTNTQSGGVARVFAAAEASMSNIAGPIPDTSNLNWTAGDTVAALVPVFSTAIAQHGGGHVVIANGSATMPAYIVDAVGYFAFQPGPTTGLGRYTALTPARIIDTRTSVSIAPGGYHDLQVAGRGGVPSSGAEAATLTVTETNAASDGWLSVYPTGSSWPGSSNLNWLANHDRTNAVWAPLSTDGKVRVLNGSGSQIDLVIDVSGYFTDASQPATQGYLFNPVFPTRITDTRASGGSLQPNSSMSYPLAATAGIPPTASAAITNMTVVNTTAGSYLATWPGPNCLSGPVVSNLNWVTGEVRADLVAAGLSAGAECIYKGRGTADLIVDLLGYFQ